MGENCRWSWCVCGVSWMTTAAFKCQLGQVNGHCGIRIPAPFIGDCTRTFCSYLPAFTQKREMGTKPQCPTTTRASTSSLALVYFEYYRLFISAMQVIWKLEWVKRTGGRERVKYRATFEHTKPPPCTCSSRTHPASHQRARAFAFL